MAVYKIIGNSLFGTAQRILHSTEDAEEAVQEAFLKFYRKAPTIHSGKLSSWLHRVVINLCLDRLRARKRKAEVAVEEEILGASRPAGGLRLDLSRAVAELPEQARLVFLLYDLEGYKHREVAASLGISEGTSKSQLFRAREMLRSRLESNWEAAS